MKLFQAIGLLKLVVPFVLLDKDGNKVVNRSITFSDGNKSQGVVIPATYRTENKDEIDYLRTYPSVGKSYKEIAKPSAPIEKKSKITIAPIQSPEEEEDEEEDTNQAYPQIDTQEGEDTETQEEEDVEEGELNIMDQITTVQQAAVFLRQLDQNVKSNDVRTKAQINDVARKLNVSFPNL